MKLEQLELGRGRAPPQKKRFIEKDKRISALFERFKEGQDSPSDFLPLSIKLDFTLSTCAFVVFIVVFIACPF